MGRANKQVGSDEAPGAPKWMVTFSDCMTLLLTFFVLLLSFSSFDNRIFRRLKVGYSTALTTVSSVRRSDRDALLYIPPVRHIAELRKGSERPTSSRELQDGLLKETKIINLTTGMAFLISSKKVFWAKGSALSPEGRRIMDMMEVFLRGSPSRIVVSENGRTNNQTSKYYGLPRAWAVIEYLTKERNLNSNRFSISAEGTLAEKSLGNGRLPQGSSETERTVEIVLLQRSIYN
ncbi:MAG: flagellar motor protein MotB [Planctomycetota bacterium]|jgi:chemotaxis protein MotB